MAQHDMTIEDGPGLSVRENINDALLALVSMNSGATEPQTLYPGQFWLDTSISPNGLLRMRNLLNSAWIAPPFLLNGGADVWFGTKLSPDRFIWNDKADASGTDIMTLSDLGKLTLKGLPTAALILNKSAGNYSSLQGMSADKLRWEMHLGDNATETGTGNAGSDLVLNAYNDAGTLLRANNLTISRSTGAMTVTGNIRSTTGHVCQPGSGGAATASVFNINYTTVAQLWVGTTNLGTISVSSDYRIKKDVEPLPSMWDTLKTLKPIKYTRADAFDGLFVADDIERWGFIAHELQEAMIEDAASGVKDAENEVQSPNPWTMLAAVVKTLQECQARIEALEAA